MPCIQILLSFQSCFVCFCLRQYVCFCPKDNMQSSDLCKQKRIPATGGSCTSGGFLSQLLHIECKVDFNKVHYLELPTVIWECHFVKVHPRNTTGKAQIFHFEVDGEDFEVTTCYWSYASQTCFFLICLLWENS